MSEQYSAPSAQSSEAAPVTGQSPTAFLPPAQEQPSQQQSGPQAAAAAIIDEKPEVAAGAAFAAGFLFAVILRRLAR